MLNNIARLGWHGLIGLLAIGAVVFVVVYGFVFRPDHELTTQAAAVLFTGAGSVIGAAVYMLRGRNGGV